MSSQSYSAGGEAQRQRNYPRPLHPGGFSLPPLVEDRLSVATYRTPSPSPPPPRASGANGVEEGGGRSSPEVRPPPPPPPRVDLLLVKPPDMESLWEWYAYTRRRTDADPSWGRVWPTALSLSRWILRALDGGGGGRGGGGASPTSLIARAARAARTSQHAVELGCGLGLAGLVYASSSSSRASSAEDGGGDGKGGEGRRRRRTMTFLDREPYALHCVMASAEVNGLATGPITAASGEASVTSSNLTGTAMAAVLTVRAAIDDWTLPATAMATGAADEGMKNVGYRDLHLGDDGGTMLLMASDVLYEPSSMESLSSKLLSLVHPIHGGYALIADPRRERTPGCRDAFVECMRNSGGEVEIFGMPDLEEERRKMGGIDDRSGITSLPVGGESDVDIDESLAKTVLIVVHFSRGKDESSSS
jgi:hypothetical protein